MFTEIIALAITLITNAATMSEPEPVITEAPATIVTEIPAPAMEDVPVISVETPSTVEDINGYTFTIAEEDGMEVVMHVVGKQLYRFPALFD